MPEKEGKKVSKTALKGPPKKLIRTVADVRKLPPPPLLGRVVMGANRGSLGGYSTGNPAIDDAIVRHSGSDIDPLLLMSIIGQESRHYPRAKSPDGGYGLGQITDKNLLSQLSDPYDVDQNVLIAANLLRDNLKRYNNNASLAVAAYNTSPRSIKEAGNDIPNKYIPRSYQNAIYSRYEALKNGQPDPFDFNAAQRVIQKQYGETIPIPGQRPTPQRSFPPRPIGASLGTAMGAMPAASASPAVNGAWNGALRTEPPSPVGAAAGLWGAIR